MLKIGLTGNIASGKSTVARAWRDLGAHVVEADELARRAVEPGTEALEAIAGRWGERVIDDTGALDRRALREIVFNDAVERQRLEQIVHPAVRDLRDAVFRDAEAAGEKLVVADVPLLFEVRMEEEFDLVVLVDASEEIRLERLIRERGLEPAEARRMMDAQMPSDRKRAHADVVIQNEGTLEELNDRARAVWEDLRQKAEAGR